MKNTFTLLLLISGLHLYVHGQGLERNRVSFDHGDVVMSETGRLHDAALEKGNQSYSEKIVGVYNESSGFSNLPIFVESGIAYVKFDVDSGHVARGDYITSSSTAGYAMRSSRSGVVLGVALENSQTMTGGLLKVRVQVGWMKL